MAPRSPAAPRHAAETAHTSTGRLRSRGKRTVFSASESLYIYIKIYSYVEGGRMGVCVEVAEVEWRVSRGSRRCRPVLSARLRIKQ